MHYTCGYPEKHVPCQALEEQMAEEERNQLADDSMAKRPVVTPGKMVGPSPNPGPTKKTRVEDASPAKPRALFTPDRAGQLLYDSGEDAQLPYPASPSPGGVAGIATVDPYADTYVDLEAVSNVQDAGVLARACQDKVDPDESDSEVQLVLCKVGVHKI